VSSLVVHPDPDGSVLVTPQSADWRYVGFEVMSLQPHAPVARATADHELCIVTLSGKCRVHSEFGDWRIGGRADPFDGVPGAAYLPAHVPHTVQAVDGPSEVAFCTAPAREGADARILACDDVEVRGEGAHERYVRSILMGDEDAESLLVCEVITPGGHWSSYPPHKHDRNALPEESSLEETYYHRIKPERGFALQRVYTDDGTLDEALAVADRDTVLVPRGYHTVSAPPGYELYYLNVMAGPVRAWAIQTDPNHEWMLQP
jgi:5-deoxy-glucuronate isomerase